MEARNQESIVLIEPVGFVSRAVAQQTNHQFGSFLGPRIRESMLPSGQLLIRTNPRPDECGHSACCRMGYIMQNPTDSRNERESSNVRTGAPREMPLLASKLIGLSSLDQS